MKRDMELVRALLLHVEEIGQPAVPEVPSLAGYQPAQVVHHVTLLHEAGYLDASDASDTSGRDYLDIELTWAGHELLETMRDSEVWAKTKAGASKVGSWSISLLAELGKAYVRQKAHDLGLPV